LREPLLVALLTIAPFSVQAGLFGKQPMERDSWTAASVAVAPEVSAYATPLLRGALKPDPSPIRGGGDIVIEDGALVSVGEFSGRESAQSPYTKAGEISVYVVREGDTLSEIAAMFDVTSKTILWANDITNPARIRPGDSLIILPITGVRHVVKTGDTIAAIAKKYQGDAADILAYNQLSEGTELAVGDTLIIPDGTISAPAPVRTAASGVRAVSSGSAAGFTHPVPGAVRTQGIHGYNGVDLAAPVGTPILAAATGEVIVARSGGWNGGYGTYIVIKHPNGTQTLYAHNSRNAVAVGDQVSAGQVIGYVGNTGRSTGSHLHFEVRGARNPF
jgi:LysM repeat protein